MMNAKDWAPDAGFEPGRRTLLKSGAAAAAALVLGVDLWPASTRAAAQGGAGGVFAPDAFIRIDGHGKVTLVMPQAEMGQGVYTSHATILAEELDVDLAQVTVEAAPPNEKLYMNPMLGAQATGNSNSVRAFWTPLRKTAARARALLVQSAASSWGVEPTSCRTESGMVIHDGTRRRISYAALVPHVAGKTPPDDVPLKAVSQFKLIGKPLRRLDTPGKVDGTASYGIDVALKGMKYATVAACPVFGGKVAHVDDTLARRVPGVRQIVVLDDLVGVVADHTWGAFQGLKALSITWAEGPNAGVDQAQVWREIEAAGQSKGAVAKSEGDLENGLRQGKRFEAVYRLPFLSHAPMEPMNYTVHVRADACEVWGGTQVAARAQAAAAKACGLKPEQVIVHNYLLGGAFGRRLEVDGVEKAVRIAKAVDGPVKVVWTREEDIQHDFYRPVYFDRLTASLSGDKVTGWHHKITGSSVFARWAPPVFRNGIDIDAVDAAIDIPYDIPNRLIEYVRSEPPAVPTSFWRGVGPNNNVFAIESFIDELAKEAGRDPVEFRRGLLGRNPRLKAALELAASKAGWGSPVPKRTGRGVAVQTSFASFIATVAEVEVDTDGQVHVRRIVSAVDTGLAVNPDTVMAQLQGGLIFGLTAALYGEITIERGRVQQRNYNDYRMLRIDEAPAIEVHVIPSEAPPGGIGETGTNAAPPAVCNAIFAATGVRLRQLPIDRRLLAAGSTS